MIDLKNKEEPRWLTDNGFVSSVDSELTIEKGKIYTVYGIVFWENAPFFYICEEDYEKYPTPSYAGFFEVMNDKLSKYWKLSHQVTLNERTNKLQYSFLVFDEWAKNEMFYENLLNGEQKEEEIFAKYRKLMDEE